jgi:hypothetical protein
VHPDPCCSGCPTAHRLVPGHRRAAAQRPPEIVALVASGRLAAVTSHGELERPGTCFVKITPSGRVATYGIGISEDAIAADPLSAFGAVAW